MKQLTILIINLYRLLVSPILLLFNPGGVCKHNPTCSEYTLQMVQQKGWFLGIIMGGKRLLSCR